MEGRVPIKRNLQRVWGGIKIAGSAMPGAKRGGWGGKRETLQRNPQRGPKNVFPFFEGKKGTLLISSQKCIKKSSKQKKEREVFGDWRLF